MSGTAFEMGLILFYFLFYFCLLLISNFRGSKNRGSMDPVHERSPWTRSIFWWTRSMDPVHGGGPWTRGPCFVLSQYSSRRIRGEYSPMFTYLEVNNCFSIIFRGKYQGLENKGLRHKTELLVCMHVCSRSFNDKLTFTSIVNLFAHRGLCFLHSLLSSSPTIE